MSSTVAASVRAAHPGREPVPALARDLGDPGLQRETFHVREGVLALDLVADDGGHAPGLLGHDDAAHRAEAGRPFVLIELRGLFGDGEATTNGETRQQHDATHDGSPLAGWAGAGSGLTTRMHQFRFPRQRPTGIDPLHTHVQSGLAARLEPPRGAVTEKTMKFDRQVVWITGAGSGIGRALALAFAREGADVALSGRRLDRLEEVAAEVTSLGRRALPVPLDVAADGACEEGVTRIVQALGRLDVAVANAGFSVNGAFESLTLDDWRRQLDVNVIGAVATARAALPELRKTNGRVVFVASVMGLLTLPGQTAYSASKFALRAIGLGLAQELHGTGVSCTTIHPGFVESEIAQVDNSGQFRAGRKDRRPQRLMWPADKAARVMVAAIHGRKREYVFTGHGKAGGFLGRHFPGLVHFVGTRKKVRGAALRTGK